MYGQIIMNMMVELAQLLVASPKHVYNTIQYLSLI